MVAERTDLADELLLRLRLIGGLGGAMYAETPQAITGGYDTAIYAFHLTGTEGPWHEPLILRLFRPGDTDRPRIEAAVQNALADSGYPCPRALLAGGDDRIDGRPYMIMERVPGRRLIDYITSPGRRTLRASSTLATAQVRLHAIDTSGLRERLIAHGLRRDDLERLTFDAPFAALESVITGLRLEGLSKAMAWLRAQRRPARAEVICHGDLHPANVMLEDDGAYHVIDWPGMRFAEPEYDVARSVILLRYAPASEDLVNGPIRALLGVGRRLLVWRYQRSYRKRRPIDAERLRWYEAFETLRVVAMTLADRSTNPWRNQPAIDGLMGHMRRTSGLELPPVRLPPG